MGQEGEEAYANGIDRQLIRRNMRANHRGAIRGGRSARISVGRPEDAEALAALAVGSVWPGWLRHRAGLTEGHCLRSWQGKPAAQQQGHPLQQRGGRNVGVSDEGNKRVEKHADAVVRVHVATGGRAQPQPGVQHGDAAGDHDQQAGAQRAVHALGQAAGAADIATDAPLPCKIHKRIKLGNARDSFTAKPRVSRSTIKRLSQTAAVAASGPC